jgi:hypothetical protein
VSVLKNLLGGLPKWSTWLPHPQASSTQGQYQPANPVNQAVAQAQTYHQLQAIYQNQMQNLKPIQSTGSASGFFMAMSRYWEAMNPPSLERLPGDVTSIIHGATEPWNIKRLEDDMLVCQHESLK